MLAILGVSVAVLFLLVVLVVYWLVMRKKISKKSFYSRLFIVVSSSPIDLFLMLVNKCSQDYSNNMSKSF